MGSRDVFKRQLKFLPYIKQKNPPLKESRFLAVQLFYPLFAYGFWVIFLRHLYSYTKTAS